MKILIDILTMLESAWCLFLATADTGTCEFPHGFGMMRNFQSLVPGYKASFSNKNESSLGLSFHFFKLFGFIWYMLALLLKLVPGTSPSWLLKLSAAFERKFLAVSLTMMSALVITASNEVASPMSSLYHTIPRLKMMEILKWLLQSTAKFLTPSCP